VLAPWAICTFIKFKHNNQISLVVLLIYNLRLYRGLAEQIRVMPTKYLHMDGTLKRCPDVKRHRLSYAGTRTSALQQTQHKRLPHFRRYKIIKD
jgi:hypothetical protein